MNQSEQDELLKEMQDSLKAYHENVDRINDRLLRVIENVKGKAFGEDVRTYIEYLDENSVSFYDFPLELTDRPLGSYHQEEDLEVIDGVWVNQYVNGGYTGDDFVGDAYIQLKPHKYLKIHYPM